VTKYDSGVTGVLTSKGLDMSLIQQQIDSNKLYRRTSGEEGTIADFRNADLRDAADCFRGLNLKEADFRGANLEGADFTEVNLEGADFQSANLMRATFVDVNLDGAIFTTANLEDAVFIDSILVWADFKDADLSGANLADGVYTYANFTGASLESAILTGAYMKWANFEGANLSGATLTDSYLSRTQLESAVTLLDWEGLVPDPTLPKRVLAEITKNTACFNMQEWDTCDTVHCLGGWINFLDPRGQGLVAEFGPHLTASILLRGAEAFFYCDEATALQWLQNKV